MTTQQITQLKFNKLTEAQYEATTPVDNEFYITTELDYALDSEAVHKSGNETITGNKVFGDGSNSSLVEIRGKSNDNTSQAILLLHIPGVRYVRLSQTGERAGLSVRKGDDSNYEYVSCATAATSDNSNYAATTAYVKGQRYIKTPDYNAVVTISNPYTAPADGIACWNNSGTGNCTINGHTFYVGGNDASNEGNVQVILAKGDVVSYSADAGRPCFVPFKS